MTGSAGRRRMLVIVNPHATTVSDRLRNLVIYALQGRFDVEVEETARPNHGIELSRRAKDGAWDVVVSFGGDGTLNEVANGLAGSRIPLAILPGGNVNVVARTLGVPNDVVEATEHLLSLADEMPSRRISLGRIGERHFLFACGCGLDASVVEKVDSNPRLKAAAGPWFYSWSAATKYLGSYMFDPVRIQVESGGRTFEGLTLICQNSDPFTFFGDRPVRACPPVGIEDEHLSMLLLKRGNQLDAMTLVSRLLSARLKVSGHGQVESFEAVRDVTVRSASTLEDGTVRSFPVQVDGDFIGRFEETGISVVPDALSLVF